MNVFRQSLNFGKKQTKTLHRDEIKFCWLMYIISFNCKLFKKKTKGPEWDYKDSMIMVHSRKHFVQCSQGSFQQCFSIPSIFLAFDSVFFNFLFISVHIYSNKNENFFKKISTSRDKNQCEGHLHLTTCTGGKQSVRSPDAVASEMNVH